MYVGRMSFDDDDDEFAIEALYRLLEEFPDGERLRCRKLFRIVAGFFAERLDVLQITALSLSDGDIRNRTSAWQESVREFDRRAEFDFDEDDRIGYLNRLCLMSIYEETTFNRDAVRLLARACGSLELEASNLISAMKLVFPESRLWR